MSQAPFLQYSVRLPAPRLSLGTTSTMALRHEARAAAEVRGHEGAGSGVAGAGGALRWIRDYRVANVYRGSMARIRDSVCALY